MDRLSDDSGLAEDLYPSLFEPSLPLSAPFTEARVLVLLTGGTICMDPTPSGLKPSPNFLATHLVPRPSFNCASPHPLPSLLSYSATGERRHTPSLRTQPSRDSRHVLYTIHELHPLLDSSSISAPAWTQLARLIQRNYALYDAFVVLHGTDSLAYTASALSYMLLNLRKPVVLTGSQVPMATLHSDATDNLIGALVVAGHFDIPEVSLFFSQRLYRGNRATKVSADAYAAFDSPNLGCLAEVKATGVKVHWNRIHRGKAPRSADGVATPTRGVRPPGLRIRAHLGTAHVACLRLFPGIKVEMLDAVIRVEGLRGLVLEAFGAGNAPIGVGTGEEVGEGWDEDGGLFRVLREASEREVVVVGVSQCLTGSVSPLYAPGRALMKANVIPGADLTTEGALTKLAFLFAGGEDETDMEDSSGDENGAGSTKGVDWTARTLRAREGMRINLRGEMSI